MVRHPPVHATARGAATGLCMAGLSGAGIVLEAPLDANRSHDGSAFARRNLALPSL